MKPEKTLTIDYPPQCEPRYGWGKPPHPQLHQILARNQAVYRDYLTTFCQYRAAYAAIPKHSHDTTTPAWINDSLPGLDAAAVYGMIRHHQPRRYVEVGIGHSTRFARRAIQEQNLNTEITAIDPFPPADMARICDHVLVERLENMDLSLFDTLQANDIVFIDNSHRALMNSDVIVAFLEILPRLPAGVLLQFHDIVLPLDYPPQWIEKYYSEQYVLAAYLLAEGQRFDVILPNAFISMTAELHGIMEHVWQHPHLNADKKIDLLSRVHAGLNQTEDEKHNIIETHGSSFWLRMR